MTVVGMAEAESVECLFFAEGADSFRREQLPAIALETVEFEQEVKEGGGEASEEDDED
jgi:hypothetical protein